LNFSEKDSGQKWLAAVSIPMLLLIAPAVGGWIGHRADERWGITPAGIASGSLLGLVVAAIRIRRLLRDISGEKNEE